MPDTTRYRIVEPRFEHFYVEALNSMGEWVALCEDGRLYGESPYPVAHHRTHEDALRFIKWVREGRAGEVYVVE